MNLSNLFIGLIAVAFGAFTLLMRVQGKTDKFAKQERMKKIFGEKGANIAHIIGYSIMPMLLGICLIIFAFLERKA